MQKRYAERLHNRDQVEVRVDGKWTLGYVLGDPAISKDKKTLWFHIQTDSHGFLDMVHHRDIR
jgi:hypothetical protein